ncbi:DNA gyrase inhibitor YacG, partial [Trichloromonas sp.]|uniref:DNA gyrase inhibitor YacG n=1 Tax=Trichloromonas sp. TaxID=3069249 RepID=UPI003D81A5CB
LKVRCPRCGVRVSWHDNKYRPFCSEKCQLIDLGRWADEEYRIAGSPSPVEDSYDEES